MTETCRVKDLKPGDHVIDVTGGVQVVKSVMRAAIFEGDAWELETDKGSVVYSGSDIVEIHN